MQLRGVGTALITPFKADGSIDEPALRKHVAWQVQSGVNFLVPCGTTGETPTLSEEEQCRVIEIVVEANAGRVPVIAGATSNSTGEAVRKAAAIAGLKGVDGILSASPYYNKPTQEGQFQHFKAIAEAVDGKPIVLYSVQGRTAVNLEPATIARLSEIANIIAVKEASGNMSQIAEVCASVPLNFTVLSGDDAITLGFIGHGGKGVVSVVSNLIPNAMAELTSAALGGDFPRAQRIQRRYLPLMSACFFESNPIPVKAVLAMMKRIEEHYRLPMVSISDANRARLDQVVRRVGLLS
ncbi:MAG: 4-hydroxy-tetrahydrodipicolinate synthase [Acidobacteriaceae bacterium]